MPRVSQLPLTTNVGTVYVIEGGVSKRVVLGGMALQSPNSVAIIGGTATLSTARATSQFQIGNDTGDSAHFLNVSNTSRSARISVDPANAGSGTLFDIYVDGSERARYLNGSWVFTGSFQVNAGDGIRVTSGTSVVLELLGRDDLGYCIVGSDTDHDVVLRRNNIEIARLASTGLSATSAIRVNSTQVISTRKTGWSAASGTATRTSFATGSVTLPQLAERVKALLDDLISHGLIGA